MKTQLTEISVRSLKPPASGQTTYWDRSIPGFGVRVSQGGTKTFVLVHGENRERRTIGRFPIISLAEARAEAKHFLAEKTLGKTRLPSITFDDAKDMFLKACEAKNRPRTVTDYRRLLTKHLPFGRRQLSEITTHQLSEKFDRLVATPAEAAHALVAAKVFFRWALRRGYLDKSPCDRLQPPTKQASRERVLSDLELAEVYAKAAGEGYPFGPIVRLMILTGQRRGEIGSLKWDYIDQDKRTITLPAATTKNRRMHTFPYGPMVQAILDALPFKDGYLFPAAREHVRGKPTTSFNGWPKAKATLDGKLENVAHWTLHDLRRTFSSNMAALQIAPHVVEKLLNHVTGTVSGVAAVYNRYQYMPEMQAAISAWEAKLASLYSP